MNGAFRAGWAEIDLTPEKKVQLVGQFCERVSEYVETPVCATALALDIGDDSVVFCACDLESIGMNLVQSVRARLAETIPDFDSRKLIVSATHTHTSMGSSGGTYERAYFGDCRRGGHQRFAVHESECGGL